MILYTIGYRGATRARLIEVLQEHGIGLLLDCRESAWGEYDFRGPNLIDALRATKIHYQHRKDWGNPFRPPRYRSTEPLLEMFEQRARERDLGGGLFSAVRLHNELNPPACLLCACKDANQCHRGVLARLAVEASRGALEVRHLRPTVPREVHGGLFDELNPPASPDSSPAAPKGAGSE